MNDYEHLRMAYEKIAKETYDKMYNKKSLGLVNVIFNTPATIVFWNDGTKTVVKCGKNDTYDPEKGLAMAISKKVMGNKGHYYECFKKFLPKEESKPAKSAAEEIREVIEKRMDEACGLGFYTTTTGSNPSGYHDDWKETKHGLD